MVSCVPKSKHVKLTLACYPKSKTAAARPNSSELQYLAYYASSRPKKLIKVGLYIRQKVVKDVYWNKQTDVIVSVDICAALVEKCHNNLNLFARDIIQVLISSQTLASKDAIALEHVASCFSRLAEHLNESLLATDEIFALQYKEFLWTLANLTIQFESERDWKATRICIDGLKAACRSKGIMAPNAQAQIAALVHSSLEILYKTPEDELYRLRSSFQRRSIDLVKHERRTSSVAASTTRPRFADAQIPQEETESLEWQVHVSALHILRILFETNDAGQIRAASIEILSFFRKHVKNESGWASTIMQFATSWTPINLRFHILGICLRQLTEAGSDSLPDASRSSLLYLIQGLLTSKVSFIGLSTVDVLETLLMFARSVSYMMDETTAHRIIQTIKLVREDFPDRVVDEKAELLLRFIRTAGSIVSHTYYEGQLADLCQSILGSLSSPSAETSSSQLLYDFIQLEVLSYLMKAAVPSAVPGESNQRIAMSHWTGSLHLLDSTYYPLRMEYIDVLLQYLQSDHLQIPPSSDDSHQTEQFLRKFQTAMFRLANHCQSSANDLLAWFVLAKSLATKLKLKHFVGFVPMFYQIVSHDLLGEPIASAFITLILSAAADHHNNRGVKSLLELESAIQVFHAAFSDSRQNRRTVTDLIQGELKRLETTSPARIALPASQTVIMEFLHSDSADILELELDKDWNAQTTESSLMIPTQATHLQNSANLSTETTSKASFELATFVEVPTSQSGRINTLKIALSTAISSAAEAPQNEISSDVRDLLDGIEMETLNTPN